MVRGRGQDGKGCLLDVTGTSHSCTPSDYDCLQKIKLSSIPAWRRGWGYEASLCLRSQWPLKFAGGGKLSFLQGCEP